MIHQLGLEKLVAQGGFRFFDVRWLPYTASDRFLFRAEKRAVIPIRQHNSLTDDLSKTTFDSTKYDAVGDLSRTHDGLQMEIKPGLIFERDPQSIAGRRFDLEQQVAFELLQCPSQDHVDLAGFESRAELDASHSGNDELEVSTVPDIGLDHQSAVHSHFSQFEITEEGRAVTHMKLLQFQSLDQSRFGHASHLLCDFVSDELFDRPLLIQSKEKSASECVEPPGLLKIL